MNFNSQWILTLIPLFLIGAVLLFWVSFIKKKKALETWILKDLKTLLVQGKADFNNLVRYALWTLACIFILLALARPQWGETWQEVQAEKAEVVFALDSSKSMLAEDLKPNRMVRAKLAVLDIFQKLKATRVGLIAFAGEAFLQCPVTVDYDAFRMALEEIDVGIIYQGGTNVAAALNLTEEVFDKENKNKIVVLLTDGEDLEQQGVEVAKRLASQGIHVYTIGIGSPMGELIPVRNEKGQIDFLKDASGKIVTTRLDEKTLKTIAQETGATYTNLQGSLQELDALINTLQEKLPKDKIGVYKKRVPNEQFQWFIGIALVLFMLDILLGKIKLDFFRKARFRSSTLLSIALGIFTLLMITSSISLAALGKQSQSSDFNYEQYLEKNKDRLSEEPNNAALLYNLGTANFQIGDYPQSLNFFQRALELADPTIQQKVYYNLGNTHYRLGEASLQKNPQETLKLWEAGLADYENALSLNPEDQDAEFNYEFLKKKVEDLKKQLKQNQNQDQQNQDQKQDQDKDKKQSQDQQNDQQGNQDSQQKDSQNQSNSSDNKSNQNQSKNQDQPENQSQNNSSSDKNQQKKEQVPANTNSKKDKASSQNLEQTQTDEPLDSQNPKGGMSKQEALQVLNSIREDEQRLPSQGQVMQPQNKDKDFKDW